MLAMFATCWLCVLGVDPLVSLPLVALLSAVLGLATNRLIIRQIVHGPMLAQIFATFGLGIFLRSLAQFLWSPDLRLVQNPLLAQIAGGRLALALPAGAFIGVPQVGAALLAGIAFVAPYLFITRTKTGLTLQAVAAEKDSAALLGIDFQRMYDLGWILGSACVGIAGAALASF